MPPLVWPVLLQYGQLLFPNLAQWYIQLVWKVWLHSGNVKHCSELNMYSDCGCNNSESSGDEYDSFEEDFDY